MYTCAHCSSANCRGGDKDGAPANCPMRDAESMAAAFERYKDDDNTRFSQASAFVEAAGYCEWPRLREVAEFCRKMGYRRIGIAFCIGLKREAKVVSDILRKFGFEVDTIVCKTGGIDKSALEIPQSDYLRPGEFEAMCNPIAQAAFLNQAKTEFNVAVGLCVGHDSLFYKYSDAPVTTLIAKDRVLAHNPAGAVYCAEGYLKKKLLPAPDEGS